MRKTDNKGFTLIELLAVIVVLSVLLVVAVPRVLNVVEEADKEAFRISGEQLIKSAINRSEILNMENPQDRTYTIENGEFVGDSIPMSGTIPENGTIVVTNAGVASVAFSNDKWCGIKTATSTKIAVTSNDGNCVFLVETPGICFTTTNIDENSVEITEYNHSECLYDVVIPHTIGGKTVRSIVDGAFYGNNLTSLVIPSSITDIKQFAFGDNLLTTVIIPDSVTNLGQGVFRDNMLTSVNIGSEVPNIGLQTFSGNQLTNVIIPNKVTNIGMHAFSYNQLTSVTLGSGLTDIGLFAFAGNQLTSLTIPDNVIYIGNNSFQYNNLTSLTIGSGEKNIDEFAFADNQFSSLIIPSNVTSIATQAFNNNQLTSVQIANNINIDEGAISYGFSQAYNTEKVGGLYTALSQYAPWTRQS